MDRRSKKTSAKDKEADAPPAVDWNHLIGYEHHRSRLVELMRKGALPHVTLIEGRRGQGKRLFAAAFAALYFCDEGTACGACRGCLSVLRQDQAEVLWVESSAQLKIADIETIQEHLSYHPARENWTARAREFTVRPLCRLAILVDCEKMTPAAANRFLKTLEEPPAAARIIMTSSRPGDLLPTVLSRTVKWHVEPPPLEESLKWLQETLAAEGEEVPPPEAVKKALKLCGLAPGPALARLKAGAEGEAEIEAKVAELLFTAPTEKSLQLAEELMRSYRLGINDLAQKVEVLLNQYYRARFAIESEDRAWPYDTGRAQRPGIEAVKEWRSLLRRVRRIGGRGQVPLNTQLTAEALALTRIQRM